MKKAITLLLILMLVMALFADCKNEDDGNQGFDVNDEDTTQYDDSGIPNPGEPSSASGGVSEKIQFGTPASGSDSVSSGTNP